MRHHVWMLLACLAPLVVIFALPDLGVRSNGLYTLLVLACFVMHLFMLRGHIRSRGKGDQKDDRY